MAVWVRQCHCGHLDLRERWESAEAADDAGVYFAAWQCPECGGSDFELVEIDDAGRVKPPEQDDAEDQ